MDLSRTSRTARLFLTVLLLAGCDHGGSRPLTVDRINFLPPQSPAAITLSDPQVYSRETLVNDRRQEATYLKGLLADSEDALFEPQIRRDLRLLTSTVIALQAAYDPLSGRQAAGQDRLDALTQQTAVTDQMTKLAKARKRLIEAERQLDAIEENQQAALAASVMAGDGSEGDQTPDADSTGADNGADENGEQEAAQTPADDSEDDETENEGGGPTKRTKKILSDLQALRTEMKALDALVSSFPTPAEVRRASVQATPREVFRDRQAYRAEIRNALAEVELDDAHDQGQNSLYRLQFRATVLPGRYQAKMGVARLTLEPPELGEKDVLQLYKTWLGHVTYRLNQPVVGSLQHDLSYLLMGMGLGNSLFHSTELKLGENSPEIFVALPPTIYARWKRVTQKGCPPDAEALEECSDLETINEEIESVLEFVHALETKRQCLPRLTSRCEPVIRTEAHDHWELLQDLASVEPFMAASLRGLGDIGSLDKTAAEKVTNLIQEIINGSDTLDRLRFLFIDKCCDGPSSLGADALPEQQFQEIPEAFVDAIVRDCGHPRSHCRQLYKKSDYKRRGVAHGGADVYATAPVELAQQISTTESAVRSFQAAVALAAALPTQGVDAGASLEHLRATRSSIEALERLPLVVGFAERQRRPATPELEESQETDSPDDLLEDAGPGVDRDARPWPIGTDPQFGWIFGPQATLDAEGHRLQLRRPLVNYPVTVDLSIPGWWPRVRLTLETAWVANWNRGEVLRPFKKEHQDLVDSFTVYLPLNRADLDGLTEYLAQETVGGALAYTSIAAISPSTITTCRKDVTFLVYGANVWRSSVAYLNGLEADSIQVLPDMAGVAVTFAGIDKGLPQIPGSGGKARLTLWTRNGASSHEVTVVDPKAAGLTCGQPEKPGLELALRKHVVVPNDTKRAQVSLRIAKGELPSGYFHLGISLRPAATLAGGATHAWLPPVEEQAVLRPMAGGSKGEMEIVGDVDLSGLALRSGDFLEVSVVEVPVKDAETERHAVDGKLVYYATSDDSRIQVKPATLESLDKNQGKIHLLFPYHYQPAYPGLRGGKVTFAVAAAGDPLGDYTLSLKSPRPSVLPKGDETDEENRVHDLTLVLGKKNRAEVTDEERKAFLNGSRTLTVTLHAEGELPEISGPVTLSKK